jgi:predicted dehydrogenase
VKPEISGAGHFYDLASHQFDYLDFVFGKVTEVHGIATNVAGYYEPEDTVSAVFSFESGVTGTGSWSFVADKQAQEDCIEITGTNGSIHFPCYDKGDIILKADDKTTKLSFVNPENISYNLVKQVVGALRKENECVSTMYSAARTNWVMEEIVKSYYKK